MILGPQASAPTPAHRCESWAHVLVNGPAAAAAEPGRITCAAHRYEEDEYRRVLQELARVESAVTRFESRRAGRHQKKGEDLIEDAVREFFRPTLTNRELCASSAYQYQGVKERQYDIAVSVDPNDPASWNASATVRELRDNERVGAHIEVAYRAKPKGKRRTASDAHDKIKEDTDVLLGSIDAAIAHQHDALPWTSLVMLGDGWPTPDKIMLRFHERHAVNSVRRPKLGGQFWWAMLDVIVTPGAFFKKHEVFWEQDQMALWPAYQHFSLAPDSIARGLAIARAFLAHRLDVRLGVKDATSHAFGYASDLSMFGPVSKAVPAATASVGAYLMHDVRDPRQVFGFEGWSQEFGVHAAMLGKLDTSIMSRRRLPIRVRFGQ